MLSQVETVVERTTTSLNSERHVIDALGRAAGDRGRVHDVIVMVELGDLREGALEDELHELVAGHAPEPPSPVDRPRHQSRVPERRDPRSAQHGRAVAHRGGTGDAVRPAARARSPAGTPPTWPGHSVTTIPVASTSCASGSPSCSDGTRSVARRSPVSTPMPSCWSARSSNRRPSRRNRGGPPGVRPSGRPPSVPGPWRARRPCSRSGVRTSSPEGSCLPRGSGSSEPAVTTSWSRPGPCRASSGARSGSVWTTRRSCGR